MYKFIKNIYSKQIINNLIVRENIKFNFNYWYIFPICLISIGYINLKYFLWLAITSFILYLIKYFLKLIEIRFFQKDLIIFIQLLRAFVQSGVDIYSAFFKIEKYYSEKSILRKELIRLKNLEKGGMLFEELLLEFGKNYPSKCLELLKTSINLSIKKGISLSLILSEVQKFIISSERNLRRKSNAIVMQRMSGVLILVILLLISIFQNFSDQSSIIDIINNSKGRMFIYFGLSLNLLGIILIFLIGRRNDN